MLAVHTHIERANSNRTINTRTPSYSYTQHTHYVNTAIQVQAHDGQRDDVMAHLSTTNTKRIRVDLSSYISTSRDDIPRVRLARAMRLQYFRVIEFERARCLYTHE